MKNQKWLTIFVWICGYGFGIAQTCTLDLSDPKVRGIGLFIGWIIGLSGWFWHFMHKPDGGIDKITNIIIGKKKIEHAAAVKRGEG